MKTFALTLALLACPAFAQAGDTAAPTAPAAAAPGTPVIIMPSSPAPASSTSLPAAAWVTLLLALLGTTLAWYQKNLQAGTQAKLDAVVKNPATSAPVRTLAKLAEDLEPVVTSMVGHILDDASTGATAGQTFSVVSRSAAEDLVDVLAAGLKQEASTFFGSAGGDFIDFVDGLIKGKLLLAQAAGVAAAAKVTTPAAAVAAMNVAAPAKPA